MDRLPSDEEADAEHRRLEWNARWGAILFAVIIMLFSALLLLPIFAAR